MRGSSTKSNANSAASREAPPDSEEQRFKQKCKELKKRITEVEESNEIATLALTRTKASIRRLRLEYAILLERLEQRATLPAFDPEDMSPPPSPKVLDETLGSINVKGSKGGSKRGNRKVGGRAGSSAGGSAAAAKLRDPNLPKRPTNAYLIFCEMEKDRIRSELEERTGGNVSELSKTITEAWNNLNEEGRAPYFKLYQDDRERYQREMVVYNQRKQEEEEEAETPAPKRQKIVLKIKQHIQPKEDKDKVKEEDDEKDEAKVDVNSEIDPPSDANEAEEESADIPESEAPIDEDDAINEDKDDGESDGGDEKDEEKDEAADSE